MTTSAVEEARVSIGKFGILTASIWQKSTLTSMENAKSTSDVENAKSMSDIEDKIVPKPYSKEDNTASDYDLGTTVSSNAI